MSLITALWTQSFSHFSIHLTVCLSRPYFQPGVCPDCPWPSSCYPSTQAPLVSPIACQMEFQLGFGFYLTSSPAASIIPWSLQPRQPLTLTRPNKPLLAGGWEVQWNPSIPDPPGFLMLCHIVLPARVTVIGSPPRGPRHQHLLFPLQHSQLMGAVAPRLCILSPARTLSVLPPHTVFTSMHTSGKHPNVLTYQKGCGGFLHNGTSQMCPCLHANAESDPT